MAERGDAVRQTKERSDGGNVSGVFVIEPMGVQGGKVFVVDFIGFQAHLHRKVEHGALARRDIGLAVVDSHLVGHQGLLLVNA